MSRKNRRSRRNRRTNDMGGVSRIALLKNILRTIPVVIGIAVIFYLTTMVKDIDVPTVAAVENIEIIGELKFLDEETILNNVGQNISEGYFAVDMDMVRERLIQEPWVKDASLRRRWPAELTVYIEEQKPVAFWNDDGYISETGEVFRPEQIDQGLGLPELEGPDNQHRNVLRFMNELHAQMSALNYRVRRLSLDERRAWQMAIIGDEHNTTDIEDTKRHLIDVKLGRFDTEKRLRRFIRILPALAAQAKKAATGTAGTDTEQTRVRVIDMRYPNGFAVQMAAQTKEA